MTKNPHPGASTADRAVAEWQEVGRLAGTGLRGLVQLTGDTHAAISRRVAQRLPPGAAPVMATERAISTAIYELVGAAHERAPAAAAALAARTVPPDRPAPTRSRLGVSALPVANGLWGDRVAADHAPLAIPMALRLDGEDVPVDSAALAAAFPDATGRIVLFLHGLSGDERWWHLEMDGSTESYGDRLAREHGFSPLVLRYNSGLHISENGERLSALLDELVAAWPVPVESLTMVGHSMGGLVARAACHAGDQTHATWTPLLRTVVSLGSPHLGSSVEKSVHVFDRLLRLFPESEPFSRPFAVRSAGIKDLRYGAVAAEDWDGHDPDEFLRDRCTDVPLLPHVTYYWVGATITRDRDHPFGRLLGDGLVQYHSASGIGHHRTIPFEIENGTHLGSVSHFRLLNHPVVYERLAGWLTTPPDWPDDAAEEVSPPGP